MAAAETLAEIRQLFRDITGLAAITQISNDNVDVQINDYYVFRLAKEVNVGESKGEQNQIVDPSAKNDYDIPTIDADIIEVKKPFYLDGEPVRWVYTDKETFFNRYPDEKDLVSETAGLAIGTSNAARFKLSNFFYDVGGFVYEYVAGSEIALTGDAIPDGKWGSWLITADTDLAITVTASALNGTGYDTIKHATEPLAVESSDSAVVGYILVLNRSGGVFTPDTTLLSAGGISDFYVELNPIELNWPEAVLVHENTIFVRPHSDNVRKLEFQVVKRRTAMSGNSDEPDNKEWGRLIAYGAAINYLTQKRKLVTQGMTAVYVKEKQLIDRINLQRLAGNTTTERALI